MSLCKRKHSLDLYAKENIACDNFTARENAACQKLIVRENASRLDLYAKENIACDDFTTREKCSCEKLLQETYCLRENTSRLDLYAKENIACDNFKRELARNLLKRECFPFRSLCLLVEIFMQKKTQLAIYFRENAAARNLL